MWAGSLVLRIGEQRDLLVVVQVDTAEGLERVRTLFEPWIEPDPAPEVLTLDPAFGVRLEPVEGRDRSRGAGLQPVPQLRYGSTVMARSREPDDVLRALALVLGGAHEHRRDDGRIWMGLRVFARGDSAVLVDLERPAMVNDRLLAQAGVDELATWSTVIEPDGRVSIPSPLPGLSWGSLGVEPPADGWRRYQFAGVAVLRDPAETPAELLADVARRSIDGRWFTLAAAMAEEARLVSVGDRPALRHQVRGLVGAAATAD